MSIVMKNAPLRLASAVLLSLGLAACADQGEDAPWLHTGNPAPSAVKPAGPSIPANKLIDVPARTVTIQPGDTLPGLSRHYGVSLRMLIQANNLNPPYALQSGRKLTIPAGRYYIVGPGESLLGIARNTGTHLSALGDLNNLQPPYGIRAGQRLALPLTSPITTAAVTPPPVNIPAPATPGKTPPPVVAPPPANGIAPIPTARPGAEPSGTQTSPAPINLGPEPPSGADAAPDTTPAAPAPAGQPMPIPSAQPTPIPSANGDQATAETGSVSTPAPPPRGGRAFEWPVRGQIISKFGPGASEGMTNPGINIAVPAGTPVHAADNGVVVYAGNELAGFGNLLLVKHDGGWMTVYAHNQQLLVHKGAIVKRGQVIAKSGSTGKVDQPQLHFEVRKDADSVDPMSYLAK